MTEVRIRRIGPGPMLIIEDAEELVAHFLRYDASAQPGGYDDLAGQGERDRITRSDIVAINATMRARSPHSAWAALLDPNKPLPWLTALDPAWDLVLEPDERWQASIKSPVEAALAAATGPGRGISVGTKVLHLKRPAMFPVLDSLVLQQLGATESIPVMKVVEHLRAEGMRNLASLRSIQLAIAPRVRSLVRILDILLWASHPAAGLGQSMSGWEHRMRKLSPSEPPRDTAQTPVSQPSSAATRRAGQNPSPPPPPGRPGFEEVWDRVRSRGGFRVVSTRNTEYTVVASVSKGRKVLVAKRPTVSIYVHEDCFGRDLTCQGVRAGGIYNGSPSLWDC